MLESRGLVKLVIFTAEELSISSWWSRLDEKLAVSGRMDLVSEMVIDAKRKISPNTLGLSYLFLYLYLTILICLSPEIWRLSYYGIRKEECEVTSLYSPLLKPSLMHLYYSRYGILHCWSGSRGYYSLFEISLLQWRVTESLIYTIYLNDTGSSFMLLGAAWVLRHGGSSW